MINYKLAIANLRKNSKACGFLVNIVKIEPCVAIIVNELLGLTIEYIVNSALTELYTACIFLLSVSIRNRSPESHAILTMFASIRTTAE
jgi:hypothetical protein